MRLSIAALTLLLVALMCTGQRDGAEKKRKIRTNPQKIAIEKWAMALTPRDYNYSEWRVTFHSRSTVDFFNGYAKRLSDVFKANNAKLNFAMIGKLHLNAFLGHAKLWVLTSILRLNSIRGVRWNRR